MKLEIDQSVRIEELNRDTIIGLANKTTSFAIILPRKIKRHFNEEFRRHGLSKRLGSVLFAASIVAACKIVKLIPDSLIIDVEYPGYDRLINKIISLYYPQAIISFKQIGKSSPAHEAAYFTHAGKRQADGKITKRELYTIITKTTGELLHLEFTRIRNPHRSVKNKYSKKR